MIREFTAQFPKVHLALRQGNPQQIARMIIDGEADIGISTEALDSFPDIVTFPCYSWHHVVVVPKGHPLVAKANVTLEEIADYPVITYDHDFTGRSHVDKAFADAGVVPDVILSAIDADVIKTYVELGMGVGIVAAMAFDETRDSSLVALDSQHLFEPSTTRVGLRRGGFHAKLCLPADRDVCAAPHRTRNRRSVARAGRIGKPAPLRYNRGHDADSATELPIRAIRRIAGGSATDSTNDRARGNRGKTSATRRAWYWPAPLPALRPWSTTPPRIARASLASTRC